MAAPDILLKRPFVLVSISSSEVGIDVSQSFGWEFGQVQLVYQTCDALEIGNSVLFRPDDGVKLVYGSSIYFMINDNNAAFVENAAP
jgi:hypothetical protein